ncbi:MAG TPA: DUF4145 domain-containing protein [Pirellulales bacterium]|nr:DUF4145 domain-containing protein [Pirellulales bacterium]
MRCWIRAPRRPHATQEGADGNRPFTEYVAFLLDKYVSENAREWVDAIRDMGNDATHEVPPIDHQRAKTVMLFAEMILKLVDEYPGEAKTI